MNTIMLNGREVKRGTRLAYLDTADFPMAPEYVTVTEANSAYIKYDGDGVDGEHRSDCLEKTFKHYEE